LADAMSQSQIDELLKNLSSGEESIEQIESETNTKKVKSYNFKMPKKFTKEQLSLVGTIFEGYARVLSSYLTSLLRIYCKVEMAQIEENRYFEFNNALPDYTMISVVSLGIDDDTLEDGGTLIQINNAITMAMIDRLEGGAGETTILDRDFTEIEVGLMSRVLERMAQLLKEPFANYIDINPNVTNIETNSRAMQVLGPDDIIILVTFDIIINNTENTVSVAIPGLVLEALMAKFSDKYARGVKKLDPKKENERQISLLQNIKDTELKVRAVFRDTELDLYDILTLTPGDIIPLQLPISSNIEVKIGGNIWFDGKLGLLGNNKAVKIDNVYNEEFLRNLMGVVS
jgi:flagellar motor switch protein FliM